MTMKDRCVAAVRAAAGGRPVSDAKLKAIEQAMHSKLRVLAARDRSRWLGMSVDQRVSAALELVQRDLEDAANLKQLRTDLAALRMAETDLEIEATMKREGLTRSQALSRTIELAAGRTDALRDEALSNLTDLLDAVNVRDGEGVARRLFDDVFSVDNPAMTADVVAFFKGWQ